MSERLPRKTGAHWIEVVTQESRLLLLRRFFPFFVLIGVCVGFGIASEQFLSLRNFDTVLRQTAVLTIAAMGGTFIILMGSIDLGVGAVTGLAAVLTAAAIGSAGALGLAGGAAVGVMAGLIVGAIYAKLKVPSFIVTLGVLVAGHGLILLITQGKPILIRDPALRAIGSGAFLGVPYIVLVAMAALAVAIAVHKYSTLGRRIVAIGGGEIVARRSGIAVDKTKIIAFTLAGLFSGVAGIVLALRMGAGSPTAGEGLELDVIAAVVLGGTPLTGGNGGPAGTLVGALIIAVLSNGLNLAGVSSYTQLVIKGAVLVLAVMISIDRKKIGIIK